MFRQTGSHRKSNMSSLSATIDNEKSFSKDAKEKVKVEVLNFEDYKDNMVSMMKEYKDYKWNNNKEDKMRQSMSLEKVMKNSKSNIELTKFLKNNSILNNSMIKSPHKKVNIQVREEEYKNPIDSFITVDKNKTIFRDFLQCNYERRKNKSEKLVDELSKSQGKNMKIKITNILKNTNDMNLAPEKRNCKEIFIKSIQALLLIFLEKLKFLVIIFIFPNNSRKEESSFLLSIALMRLSFLEVTELNH